MQETDQGKLQAIGRYGRRRFRAALARAIHWWLALRRRRAIAPPITSAAPNKSAVTGSGTGAGPGSLGVVGGLKAWSGSWFGHPKLNKAAIREIPRIKRLAGVLDFFLDPLQGKSEVKSWFMFLIGLPSFYRK
jgi:hypothetical protein